MLDIRKNSGYLMVGIVLCVLTMATWTWLAWSRKAKVPAGFKPTNIPGIFVNQRVLDLGEVNPDQLVDIKLDMANVSRYSITVERVYTSCGCTIVNLTERSLWPNSFLSIPIKVDTSKLSGSVFNKKVLIILDGKDLDGKKKIFVHLKGTINRTGTFVAWPGILNFGDVVPGQLVQKHVYFKGNRELLARVPSVMEIHKLPKGRLELQQNEPGGKINVKDVKFEMIIPESAPEGPLETSVTVEVVGNPPHRIIFPVHAKVFNDVVITPAKIYMTVLESGESPSVSIKIRSIRSDQIRVDSIKCPLPIKWNIKPISAKSLTITAQPLEDTWPDKILYDHVDIEMNGAKSQTIPVVLVPISITPEKPP